MWWKYHHPVSRRSFENYPFNKHSNLSKRDKGWMLVVFSVKYIWSYFLWFHLNIIALRSWFVMSPPLTLSVLFLINEWTNECICDKIITGTILRLAMRKFHTLIWHRHIVGNMKCIAQDEQKTPILTPLMLAISIQNVWKCRWSECLSDAMANPCVTRCCPNWQDPILW